MLTIMWPVIEMPRGTNSCVIRQICFCCSDEGRSRWRFILTVRMNFRTVVWMLLEFSLPLCSFFDSIIQWKSWMMIVDTWSVLSTRCVWIDVCGAVLSTQKCWLIVACWFPHRPCPLLSRCSCFDVMLVDREKIRCNWMLWKILHIAWCCTVWSDEFEWRYMEQWMIRLILHVVANVINWCDFIFSFGHSFLVFRWNLDIICRYIIKILIDCLIYTFLMK